MISSVKTFSCAIVGMKFRPPAQGILNVLAAGFPLVLRREPGNQYDVNAVQVIVESAANFAELNEAFVNEKLAGYGFTKDDVLARLPFQIGYIPREDAERIAPLVDELGRPAWRGVLSFSATGQPRVNFQLQSEPEREDENDNRNEGQ